MPSSCRHVGRPGFAVEFPVPPAARRDFSNQLLRRFLSLTHHSFSLGQKKHQRIWIQFSHYIQSGISVRTWLREIAVDFGSFDRLI
ncbi:hypothetical protein LWI28_025627 [Acer negundo]|uniref:Uncharacterized protein n=1 Tax=Acer negundo TaxID=4023 RepID=A0AAD5JH42_ACENE|nr:hypothetical protein LWI28_025627 [Acer negundo]